MVNDRLEEVMINSFQDVVAFGEKHRVNNRTAAYMLALERVGLCDQAAGNLRLVAMLPIEFWLQPHLGGS